MKLLLNAKFLYEKRNQKGMTQKQVANAIGKTESYYCLLEKGVRTPSVGVAMELAKIFNCTVDELLISEGAADKAV